MIRNKILKFIELVKENFDEDLIELQDVTLELKDELIDFEIIKGYYSEKNLSGNKWGDVNNSAGMLYKDPTWEDDKKCLGIYISLRELEGSKVYRSGGRRFYRGDKIWKIFSELSDISGRYSDSMLYFDNDIGDPKIILFLFFETEIDKSELKIRQIYQEIKGRLNQSTSDFSNSTTIKIEDDKIVISSSYEYTDRKFRNLIRGIDMTGFELKKEITKTEKYPYEHVQNIISKK